MSDVSRETLGLGEPYGEFDQLREYARILATTGLTRGLLGPREIARIWPRHILNCAVVTELEYLKPGATVIDVGSGSGLPGVVWAIIRPDLRITLLEPLLRRSEFLSEVVAQLRLGDRVRVHRGRAEDYRGPLADVVTARAVSALPKLAGWTLPLTRRGGWVLALKGAGAGEEVAAASGVIARLGGRTPLVLECGVGVADPATIVVAIRKR